MFKLNKPYSIAVTDIDDAGDMNDDNHDDGYFIIADAMNNRICNYGISSGTILTCFYGNQFFGDNVTFSFPTSIVYSHQTEKDFLYIGEKYRSTIRKYDINSNYAIALTGDYTTNPLDIDNTHILLEPVSALKHVKSLFYSLHSHGLFVSDAANHRIVFLDSNIQSRKLDDVHLRDTSSTGVISSAFSFSTTVLSLIGFFVVSLLIAFLLKRKAKKSVEKSSGKQKRI
jgi:hypothetical protein